MAGMVYPRTFATSESYMEGMGGHIPRFGQAPIAEHPYGGFQIIILLCFFFLGGGRGGGGITGRVV